MIPLIYREPLGLPLRWQDEQSGELPAAVLAFFERKPLSERQFTLVRNYCIHYIGAPCWDRACHDDDGDCIENLFTLREVAGKIARQADFMPWIEACLDSGIDPL